MSADIPPEKSTSFYVRGLGADTTFSDILAAIRGVGRIYHLQVSPPTGVHPGCTAMICFFTRAAAEKFRNQTLAGFRVKGYNAKVVWNWILVSEQMKWKNASRVLIIRGPDSMVNVTVISEFINKLIPKYDMENIYLKPHESIQGFSELQLHFGGFRGQAGRAMVALKRKFRGSGVRITYGDDPCE
ncbi:hypothetical protein QBC39DRAFT_352604 [Podospora conica]|nr:hypothetical protein QBC39DRAFT_352604 [Schizothecium conicum]